MNKPRTNLYFFDWLSDENVVTNLTQTQLEAMKKVCAKVLGCRVLGVPLPRAIVEALHELRDESTVEKEAAVMSERIELKRSIKAVSNDLNRVKLSLPAIGSGQALLYLTRAIAETEFLRAELWNKQRIDDPVHDGHDSDG